MNRSLWLEAWRGTHSFAERWNHNTHYYPVLARRLGNAQTVLDVGCGEGTFCRLVAGDGRLVIGLDSDVAGLPPGSAGLHYLAGSADTLPFRDGAFDAVTATMVMHHVDVRRGLAEAARVLAPGGVLLVLGYGRYGGARDLLPEVRDVVAQRLVSSRVRPWDPPTAKADAIATWPEARAAARAELPGCSYRRLTFWRSLVQWRKPPR